MTSVALVSMPWMAAGMPSIQLATLAATLDHEGITSRSYEFFLDYAATIGLHLYERLCDAGGFTEEWLFARHYFGEEHRERLDEFRTLGFGLGLDLGDREDAVLDALVKVTAKFVRDIADDPCWSEHDIVGMSLTISQNAASMALARELKQRHPHLKIVFGGSACAGPMGPAMLRACPEVDAVVTVEGELVLGDLVRRWRAGEPIADLAGVFSREGDEVVGAPAGPLHVRTERSALNYDAYFARLQRTGLADRIPVWLPFESSRGCWWGEKSQCTFCGLHEIMTYRGNPAEPVLAELELLEERYGIGRFFAVDLIMPVDYLRTLLPEIHRRGHDWSLFYEVKANLKRDQIALLAAAGVRWIQPGIESLDDTALAAMKKGVSALQNVQLLKWSAEHDVRATWNFIVGLPGEDPASYARVAALLPWLHHLTPPSGASTFQLHRFSPYFEEPEQWGIERLGALPIYHLIYPLEPDLVDDLVYMHAYRIEGQEDISASVQVLRTAIAAWSAASQRGAALTYEPQPGGGARIIDSRTLPERQIELTAEEAAVYALLDPACTPDRLFALLDEQAPHVARLLDADAVAELISRWEDDRLVLRLGGRLLSLALAPPASVEEPGPDAELRLPVPYLERLPVIPN